MSSGDVIIVKMSEPANASDLELLARYTRHHAEDAFATLARRHVDLVYSAALRQVRSPQLAEEVAQTTFTKLARVAPQLAPDTILTAWLYQVTRREAIDVVRREARRQLREQIATELNTMNATTADWAHIEPILDEAMAELDDTDRAAVLLRYFENKSLREVGATLRISDDAAQKRVSRAVERLREFFAKRGVTVGTSGLVVVISANAVQAAPVGLAITISTAAALAGTTLATATTATAIKTIAMTTLQKTVITATLAVVAGVGIYEARQYSQLRKQNQVLQQQQALLTEENQRLQSELGDATGRLTSLQDDNDKLNRYTAELLKLRGEVNHMRQELASSTTKETTSNDQTSAQLEAAQPPEAVQIFVANADANVPSGQSLAFGGWVTSPGKRMLVFVEPKITEQSSPDRVGQVFLQGNFIEVPEEVLVQLATDSNFDALKSLRTTGKASSTQIIMTATQTRLILETLKKTPGVDVFGSPRILTGDGGQAVVRMTEQSMVAGKEHSLGPSLDVEPRIAADGTSVNLTVSARLKKANPNP